MKFEVSCLFRLEAPVFQIQIDTRSDSSRVPLSRIVTLMCLTLIISLQVQYSPLCISTLVISYAHYEKATGRRPLPENPILVEQLAGAFAANRAFETLPAIEDWPAGEVSEMAQFFAENCFDADAAVIVVFGHATSDLQHLYACNNELVSIKNALLDPIVNASPLMEKPKIFIFCLNVEHAFRREKIYGFASDDVKIFLQPNGSDFVSELCRMLRSDENAEGTLYRLENLCRNRCTRL